MGEIDFIFLGATNYSFELLNFLVENKYIPKAIFYIPKNYKIKIKGKWYNKINYNYADLTSFARPLNIPYFEVNSLTGKRLKDYKEIIRKLNVDIILALGWYYMIPKEIRELAKYGAWGIHASLLPKYAGGAPLVWAIINGEKETGVTLFKMYDGVDDGDIIAQKSFPIDFDDNIKSVYDKATNASKEILLEVFNNFSKLKFIPQDKTKIQVYPQRSPEDGEINWNNSAFEIYNFIRAQTFPYPCAFSEINGTTVKIVNSQIVHQKNQRYQIGEVVVMKNMTVVATKDKFLKLGDIYVEGEKYRFEDYARVKNLGGGVFKSRKP